jgi:hypothetical protein
MIKKCAFVLLAACGGKQSLVLYTWSDMIPQEIMSNEQ